MLAQMKSMGLMGIDGYAVTVEAYLSAGMPMFELVGLPDAAVRESRERVRAAMLSCNYEFPVARMTINLAPADVRKEGPSFDLPIALTIMAAAGYFEAEKLEGIVAIGELSLNGAVTAVRGVLPMIISARALGVKEILLPAGNAQEVRCVEGVRLIPVENLAQAVAHVNGTQKIMPMETTAYAALLQQRHTANDLANVRGQHSAKRALEIAAAGGHNVLLLGHIVTVPKVA